jgi:hypothetical protein
MNDPVKLDERSSWMNGPVKSSLMNDLDTLAGRTVFDPERTPGPATDKKTTISS